MSSAKKSNKTIDGSDSSDSEEEKEEQEEQEQEQEEEEVKERTELPTLYNTDTNGRTRMWKIWVEGDTYHTESGLLDGKHVTSERTCEGKNIGRSNETTPEEQAVKEAKSKWKDQKIKKGYTETVPKSVTKSSTSSSKKSAREKNSDNDDNGDEDDEKNKTEKKTDKSRKRKRDDEDEDDDDSDGGSEGDKRRSTTLKIGDYDAMLASKWENEEDRINFPAYAQPKLDGKRCLCQLDSAFYKNNKNKDGKGDVGKNSKDGKDDDNKNTKGEDGKGDDSKDGKGDDTKNVDGKDSKEVKTNVAGENKVGNSKDQRIDNAEENKVSDGESKIDNAGDKKIDDTKDNKIDSAENKKVNNAEVKKVDNAENKKINNYSTAKVIAFSRDHKPPRMNAALLAELLTECRILLSRLPPRSCLDGELYSHGKSFEDIMSAVTTWKPKRQKTSKRSKTDNSSAGDANSSAGDGEDKETKSRGFSISDLGKTPKALEAMKALEVKDGKINKGGKNSKDNKDNKNSKDGKNGKDSKDGKNGKDSKDGKNGKNDKDSKVALNYCVYDFQDKGCKLTTEKRMKILNDAIAAGTVAGEFKIIQSVPIYLVKNKDEMLEKLKAFVDNKYEGLMIRTMDSVYEPKKRSKHLVKVKHQDDEEFEIIGASEAKGNRKGCVIWKVQDPQDKSIVFNAMHKTNVEESRELYKNRQDYIGKMVTVMFQGRSKQSIPRFPRAIKIKEDDE